MNQPLKQQFDDQGYVFQAKFQTETQVQEILANLRRVRNDIVPCMSPEHVFYEDKNNPESLKQLQELHVHDDYFGKLMNSGSFRELAEKLLGNEVVCKNLQYFNKPPGIGQATPAHQDGFYFKLEPCEAVTMWMALEPVDQQNGCVRYVPGSHKLGMRPHCSTGTLGFSQGIPDFPKESEKNKEIAFPVQPGDLLAHHALTIHRADGNSSKTRSRQALGFIYYSVNAREDLEAHEKYQSALKSELTHGNKI